MKIKYRVYRRSKLLINRMLNASLICVSRRFYITMLITALIIASCTISISSQKGNINAIDGTRQEIKNDTIKINQKK